MKILVESMPITSEASIPVLQKCKKLSYSDGPSMKKLRSSMEDVVVEDISA
jgi:hypothetical protein